MGVKKSEIVLFEMNNVRRFWNSWRRSQLFGILIERKESTSGRSRNSQFSGVGLVATFPPWGRFMQIHLGTLQ